MEVLLSKMEAVLPKVFATAKSGFASPLRSAMLTAKGPEPVGKSTRGAKVGVVAAAVVVLSRMETLLTLGFYTAKSNLLSPLKSPTLTE